MDQPTEIYTNYWKIESMNLSFFGVIMASFLCTKPVYLIFSDFYEISQIFSDFYVHVNKYLLL